MMSPEQLSQLLAFVRSAEGLKNVTRTAWTSSGKQESTAEHSWRLSLLALSLSPWFPELDLSKVLSLAIVHDLGECLHGDISAVEQGAGGNKAEREREDLVQLLSVAPDVVRERILFLWEEYESGACPEAKFIKAIDKIETILQHNQGMPPGDFNFAFNLEYGKAQAAFHPLVQKLRAQMDADTRERARAAGQLP